jgi:hypothetical protein
MGPYRYLRQPIYHAHLLEHTVEERKRRCEHYESNRPGLIVEGMSFNEAFYLPEWRKHAPRTLPVVAADRDAISRFVNAAERLPEAEPRRLGTLATVSAAEVEKKSEAREVGPGAYRARIRLLDDDLRITAGEYRTFDLEVENLGDERWPAGLDGRPQIRLACRWITADGNLVDAERTGFGSPVAPSERVIVPLNLVGPTEPGEYVVEIDLVHEYVRWFGVGIRATLAVESPATDGRGTMGACSARPSTTSSRS